MKQTAEIKYLRQMNGCNRNWMYYSLRRRTAAVHGARLQNRQKETSKASFIFPTVDRSV